MEQSAWEALMLGVSIFVFVIALSAAVLLMTNILDMVNIANERAMTGMNGSLAESIGVIEERTYTGAQLLTYYREQQEELEELQGQGKELKLKYEFQVVDGLTKTLEEYIKSKDISSYFNKEFLLTYKGETEGKYKYVFSVRQSET